MKVRSEKKDYSSEITKLRDHLSTLRAAFDATGSENIDEIVTTSYRIYGPGHSLRLTTGEKKRFASAIRKMCAGVAPFPEDAADFGERLYYLIVVYVREDPKARKITVKKSWATKIHAFCAAEAGFPGNWEDFREQVALSAA